MAKQKKSVWHNNEIQFARLICEIVANIEGKKGEWKAVREEMGLMNDDFQELFDRAHMVWEQAKLDAK